MSSLSVAGPCSPGGAHDYQNLAHPFQFLTACLGHFTHTGGRCHFCFDIQFLCLLMAKGNIEWVLTPTQCSPTSLWFLDIHSILVKREKGEKSRGEEKKER